MKKFIIGACTAVVLLFAGFYAYYYLGVYIDFHPHAPVTTFMRTDEDTIYMERDGEYVPFEIRGVDLGAGMPGEYATDFAIDKETYKRWFGQIQELGANTIRIYTLSHDDFYNAFYEYNTERVAAGEDPLWLLHGVWVDDYSHNSHKDAFDDGLLPELIEDMKIIIDILHGNRFHLGRDGDGSGFYRHDVSQWVLGYILGVEWEASLVAYTNQNNPHITGYEGEYMRTAPEATPFECMLAELGDTVIAYESARYKEQRLVAFSNWPATDPFVYSIITTTYRHKTATINVEHIEPTERFVSGYFASYHVYPYFPDFLQTEKEAEQYTREELETLFGENQVNTIEHRLELLDSPNIHECLTDADYYDAQGRLNTYYAYLRALNRFHNIPVVISEYGITTGRGRAQEDVNTGRNQGHVTEQEQGQYIIECYEDIMNAGSAGSCLFSWQDEWFKRTWNTLYAVDLDRPPYWSDYQTNEQSFGVLTFDPGWEESVSYTDGDPSEWTQGDLVWSSESGSLYMKYDEKFLYFYYDGDAESAPVYIPIDTTPKSGSTYCENYDLIFDRGVDFVICIDGINSSRVVVQERYEVLKSTYWESYYVEDPYIDPPDKDSPVFVDINMAMKLMNIVPEIDPTKAIGEIYETGILRHGNGNPESEDFDSLTDFCFTPEGGVEIRIPWQLLNFADPSRMNIHDDYYEHYGIEYIQIDELYVGVCTGGEDVRIRLAPFSLEGWGNHPSYHERLKESYYILQNYWAQLDR